jgi:hypothetical protein
VPFINAAARDIAFVIGNVEAYLQYTDVCGWTTDEWQERTAAVLAAASCHPWPNKVTGC